jgi:hypothetical protein
LSIFHVVFFPDINTFEIFENKFHKHCKEINNINKEKYLGVQVAFFFIDYKQISKSTIIDEKQKAIQLYRNTKKE